MIVVEKKEKCAGCSACIMCCPTDAIFYERDIEGFNYPKVDLDKCIECGLCEITCPWLDDEYENRKEEYISSFYAAQLVDKSQLSEVSSGGAAWGLALYVLSINGVIYGAFQRDVDTIFHSRCDNFEDLKNIRRSKYLQSDLKETFKEAKKDLENGKTVLFTGTGCQIAGLLYFLRKKYDNLITADVVCHGVPSPAVWKSYKSECEKKQSSKMVDLIFRDKSAGWDNNKYCISFSDGTTIRENSIDNPFHRGYLLGLYSRPSCSECQFNLLPRISDFTFADYWRYDGERFQETLKLGISLVAVNTIQAEKIIGQLGNIIEFEPTTREKALASCRQMNNAPIVSQHRDKFWEIYLRKGFSPAWKECIREKRINLIKGYLRALLRKIVGSK